MFAKRIKILFASIIAAAAVVSQPVMARHGDVTVLPNRIPEAAPYVNILNADGITYHAEGGFTPPFDWASNNVDSGRCNGCHSVIFNQWNGAMMSTAWRDPGWRGAFLLVARATSTDGCADIPKTSKGLAADGTKAYDCSSTGKILPDGSGRTLLNSLNPFAASATTSAFNTGIATSPKTTTGSGSLMDDFCSRCHMPTDYIDATMPATKVSGLEHADIFPTFDPTEKAGATLTDPGQSYAVTGISAQESFGTRAYTARAANGRTPTANTNSGKAGITCVMCHTNVDSKDTPYSTYKKSTNAAANPEYIAADSTLIRTRALPEAQWDILNPPDVTLSNLGYSIGAGTFRVSGHAVENKERFGPLAGSAAYNATKDTYLEAVFDYAPIYFQQAGNGGSANLTGTHDKFYHVKFERSEFCGACHDVTNPVTIKNPYGFWAGGFPIERTYTEWLNSRYAKRVGSPSNVYGNNTPNPDGTIGGKWERDCQSCHMQQNFGEPGTALTLFNGDGKSEVPLSGPSHDSIERKPHWTHHFVGGNAYITKMIGADVQSSGAVQPYPELLNTSFSSSDGNSRLNSARFTFNGTTLPPNKTGFQPARQTQHERFAWDRLRNAVKLRVDLVNGNTVTPSSTPLSIAKPAAGVTTPVKLNITMDNDGAGHNFPTGFPEGRAGWVRIAAWDTRGGTVSNPYNKDPATGKSVELDVRTYMTTVDGRILTPVTSAGVGYLTNTYIAYDPNYPGSTICQEKDAALPLGSIDPYAWQLKAVATLDKKCPTLDLPYATPVNLVVNSNNVPIDVNNKVIDGSNPTGIPRYTDTDGDGDYYDDSYLMDTRLAPRPMRDAVAYIQAPQNGLRTTRKYYELVVPGTLPSGLAVVGPIAITATVYYQSFEAVVSRKFLGNLANFDDDLHPTSTLAGVAKGPILEPCVLNGLCDNDNTADPKQPLPGSARETELKDALKFDPIVVEGAPPVPMEVVNGLINFTNTTDNVAPTVVVNNSAAAAIPANRQLSPAPFNGESGVDHRRVVKVSFSEPVKGVNQHTFSLTEAGRPVNFHIDQIDDTTWALFPYEYEDSGTNFGRAFLSDKTYVATVVPSNTVTVGGVTTTHQVTDFNGNPLAASFSWSFSVANQAP